MLRFPTVCVVLCGVLSHFESRLMEGTSRRPFRVLLAGGVCSALRRGGVVSGQRPVCLLSRRR